MSVGFQIGILTVIILTLGFGLFVVTTTDIFTSKNEEYENIYSAVVKVGFGF
jgi:hypothetical protein